MKSYFQEQNKWTILSIVVVICMVLSPFYFRASTQEIPFSNDEIVNMLEVEDNSFDGANEVSQFASFAEMNEYIEYNKNMSNSYYSYYLGGGASLGMAGMSGSPSTSQAPGATLMMSGGADSASNSYNEVSGEFSSTNIQVENVDEGDTVKNDNEFAYVMSSNKVTIIDVFPPDQINTVKVLNFSGNLIEIYVNSGMLLVIGQEKYDRYSYDRGIFVNVFDLENKSEPELIRNESFAGSHTSSRIVNNHLYLITNKYISNLNNESQLPAAIDEIYYIDEHDSNYQFTMIHSMNFTNDAEPVNSKVIMSGQSRNIYASTENIYITCQRRLSRVAQNEIKILLIHSRILPDKYKVQIDEIMDSDAYRWEKISKANKIVVNYLANCTNLEKKFYYQSISEIENEVLNGMNLHYLKTTIHRIKLDNGDIDIMASGQVSGKLHNRYSMDEYDGYFRIATTTGQVFRNGDDTSLNHLYVLNMDLEITGSINDIAPGEKIYSARFMGDRGYIVTFKKVDPFFVIDLSDPHAPVVAGELKIPGYSDYLHPMDENHVLGIGKDTIDMGDFAWFQGVKISLFDVTDMNNPKELDNFIIGDRGTSSEVLRDPHALTFSLEKEMFVMPINLAEIDYSNYESPPPPNAYGSLVWRGAYVFSFDVDEGFTLEGTIEHYETGTSSYYSRYPIIYRTFYMDDYLYSVSNDQLMAHNINTLEEINDIELP